MTKYKEYSSSILRKYDFNPVILDKFKIEITASFRQSWIPRNHTKDLILLML